MDNAIEGKGIATCIFEIHTAMCIHGSKFQCIYFQLDNALIFMSCVHHMAIKDGTAMAMKDGTAIHMYRVKTFSLKC